MKRKPTKQKTPKPSILRDQDYWDRLEEEIEHEESRRAESSGRKGSRGTWDEGDAAADLADH